MDLNIKHLAERLYLTAFILYLAYAFSLTTVVNLLPIIQTIVLQLAITLVVLKLAMVDSFTRNQKWGYGLIFALTFLVAFYMQDFNVNILFLFALGARNIDYRKIVAIYFWETVMLLAATIILTLHGDVVNLTYGRGMHIRNSLGIIYPTNFAAHVFYIMLSYIYLRKNKLFWYEYIIGIGISLLTYRVTWTRLDFILMIGTILFFSVIRYGFKNKVTWLNQVAVWSIFIGTIIIIVLSASYRPDSLLLSKLNSILSNRLSLGKQAITQYPLSNFGRLVPQMGNGGIAGQANMQSRIVPYFYIDASFLRLFLMQGFWYSLIMLVGFTAAIKRALKQGDTILPLIVIFIAISSMIDEHFNVVAYNPFILIMFRCFDDWFEKSGQYLTGILEQLKVKCEIN